MAGIELRSAAFSDHDMLPDRLSMDGGNTSPPLQWSGVPESATELVLLVEDPDAGRTPWLHWLVTGIDPASSGTGEGQAPAAGTEWTNDFGATGWGGPKPPRSGPPHRYFFRLFAIDKPLRLPDRPHVPDVLNAVVPLELASGNLVGTFER